MLVDTTDILVIGAGPCGLAVGVAAKRAGLGCVMLDRRTIVSTIERYPLGMTFFSTPERIEIGGVPFISSHEKPTRRDGLIYYRRVAEHYGLDVRPSEEVVDVAQEGDGAFRVEVRRPHDELTYHAGAVVFAEWLDYALTGLLTMAGVTIAAAGYHRLRGEKEGGDTADLARVFE